MAKFWIVKGTGLVKSELDNSVTVSPKITIILFRDMFFARVFEVSADESFSQNIDIAKGDIIEYGKEGKQKIVISEIRSTGFYRTEPMDNTVIKVCTNEAIVKINGKSISERVINLDFPSHYYTDFSNLEVHTTIDTIAQLETTYPKPDIREIKDSIDKTLLDSDGTPRLMWKASDDVWYEVKDKNDCYRRSINSKTNTITYAIDKAENKTDRVEDIPTAITPSLESLGR